MGSTSEIKFDLDDPETYFDEELALLYQYELWYLNGELVGSGHSYLNVNFEAFLTKSKSSQRLLEKLHNRSAASYFDQGEEEYYQNEIWYKYFERAESPVTDENKSGITFHQVESMYRGNRPQENVPGSERRKSILKQSIPTSDQSSTKTGTEETQIAVTDLNVPRLSQESARTGSIETPGQVAEKPKPRHITYGDQPSYVSGQSALGIERRPQRIGDISELPERELQSTNYTLPSYPPGKSELGIPERDLAKNVIPERKLASVPEQRNSIKRISFERDDRIKSEEVSEKSKMYKTKPDERTLAENKIEQSNARSSAKYISDKNHDDFVPEQSSSASIRETTYPQASHTPKIKVATNDNIPSSSYISRPSASSSVQDRPIPDKQIQGPLAMKPPLGRTGKFCQSEHICSAKKKITCNSNTCLENQEAATQKPTTRPTLDAAGSQSEESLLEKEKRKEDELNEKVRKSRQGSKGAVTSKSPTAVSSSKAYKSKSLDEIKDASTTRRSKDVGTCAAFPRTGVCCEIPQKDMVYEMKANDDLSNEKSKMHKAKSKGKPDDVNKRSTKRISVERDDRKNSEELSEKSKIYKTKQVEENKRTFAGNKADESSARSSAKRISVERDDRKKSEDISEKSKPELKPGESRAISSAKYISDDRDDEKSKSFKTKPEDARGPLVDDKTGKVSARSSAKYIPVDKDGRRKAEEFPEKSNIIKTKPEDITKSTLEKDDECSAVKSAKHIKIREVEKDDRKKSKDSQKDTPYQSRTGSPVQSIYTNASHDISQKNFSATGITKKDYPKKIQQDKKIRESSPGKSVEKRAGDQSPAYSAVYEPEMKDSQNRTYRKHNVAEFPSFISAEINQEKQTKKSGSEDKKSAGKSVPKSTLLIPLAATRKDGSESKKPITSKDEKDDRPEDKTTKKSGDKNISVSESGSVRSSPKGSKKDDRRKVDSFELDPTLLKNLLMFQYKCAICCGTSKLTYEKRLELARKETMQTILNGKDATSFGDRGKGSLSEGSRSLKADHDSIGKDGKKESEQTGKPLSKSIGKYPYETGKKSERESSRADFDSTGKPSDVTSKQSEKVGIIASLFGKKESVPEDSRSLKFTGEPSKDSVKAASGTKGKEPLLEYSRSAQMDPERTSSIGRKDSISKGGRSPEVDSRKSSKDSVTKAKRGGVKESILEDTRSFQDPERIGTSAEFILDGTRSPKVIYEKPSKDSGTKAKRGDQAVTAHGIKRKGSIIEDTRKKELEGTRSPKVVSGKSSKDSGTKAKRGGKAAKAPGIKSKESTSEYSQVDSERTGTSSVGKKDSMLEGTRSEDKRGEVVTPLSTGKKESKLEDPYNREEQPVTDTDKKAGKCDKLVKLFAKVSKKCKKEDRKVPQFEKRGKVIQKDSENIDSPISEHNVQSDRNGLVLKEQNKPTFQTSRSTPKEPSKKDKRKDDLLPSQKDSQPHGTGEDLEKEIGKGKRAPTEIKGRASLLDQDSRQSYGTGKNLEKESGKEKAPIGKRRQASLSDQDSRPPYGTRKDLEKEKGKDKDTDTRKRGSLLDQDGRQPYGTRKDVEKETGKDKGAPTEKRGQASLSDQDSRQPYGTRKDLEKERGKDESTPTAKRGQASLSDQGSRQSYGTRKDLEKETGKDEGTQKRGQASFSDQDSHPPYGTRRASEKETGKYKDTDKRRGRSLLDQDDHQPYDTRKDLEKEMGKDKGAPTEKRGQASLSDQGSHQPYGTRKDLEKETGKDDSTPTAKRGQASLSDQDSRQPYGTRKDLEKETGKDVGTLTEKRGQASLSDRDSRPPLATKKNLEKETGRFKDTDKRRGRSLLDQDDHQPYDTRKDLEKEMGKDKGTSTEKREQASLSDQNSRQPYGTRKDLETKMGKDKDTDKRKRGSLLDQDDRQPYGTKKDLEKKTGKDKVKPTDKKGQASLLDEDSREPHGTRKDLEKKTGKYKVKPTDKKGQASLLDEDSREPHDTRKDLEKKKGKYKDAPTDKRRRGSLLDKDSRQPYGIRKDPDKESRSRKGPASRKNRESSVKDNKESSDDSETSSIFVEPIILTPYERGLVRPRGCNPEINIRKKRSWWWWLF